MKLTFSVHLSFAAERKGEILTACGFDIEGNNDVFEKYVSKDRLRMLLDMPCGSRKTCPIHTAVENGFVPFVKKLVSIYPSIISVQDSDGNTPLHIATKNSTLLSKPSIYIYISIHLITTA